MKKNRGMFNGLQHKIKEKIIKKRMTNEVVLVVTSLTTLTDFIEIIKKAIENKSDIQLWFVQKERGHINLYNAQIGKYVMNDIYIRMRE